MKYCSYFLTVFFCFIFNAPSMASQSSIEPTESDRRIDLARTYAQQGKIDFARNLLSPVSDGCYPAEKAGVLSLISIQEHLRAGDPDRAAQIYWKTPVTIRKDMPKEIKETLYAFERSSIKNISKDQDITLLFKYSLTEEESKLRVPEGSVLFHLNWGNHYVRHGEWEKAIGHLHSVLNTQSPLLEGVYTQLAHCHGQLGRHDFANHYRELAREKAQEKTTAYQAMVELSQKRESVRHEIVYYIIWCQENPSRIHEVLTQLTTATIELFHMENFFRSQNR